MKIAIHFFFVFFIFRLSMLSVQVIIVATCPSAEQHKQLPKTSNLRASEREWAYKACPHAFHSTSNSLLCRGIVALSLAAIVEISWLHAWQFIKIDIDKKKERARGEWSINKWAELYVQLHRKGRMIWRKNVGRFFFSSTNNEKKTHIIVVNRMTVNIVVEVIAKKKTTTSVQTHTFHNWRLSYHRKSVISMCIKLWKIFNFFFPASPQLKHAKVFQLFEAPRSWAACRWELWVVGKNLKN